MSKRHWGIICSIGLTIVLAGLLAYKLIDYTASKQASYEQTAKDNANNYAKRRDIIIHDTCDKIVAADKQAACINEQRDTARKGKHDEYDLEAQRTTAAWTAAMGIAAIVGMAVGIIGVGLIWITFHETRRTANAALNANLISQNADRAQNEAKIILNHFAFYYVRNMPHDTEATAIELGLINMGSTQALNIKCDMSAFIKNSTGEVIWQRQNLVKNIKNTNPCFQESLEIELFDINDIDNIRSDIIKGLCTIDAVVTASYNTEYMQFVSKVFSTSFLISVDRANEGGHYIRIGKPYVRFMTETTKSASP